MKLPLLKKPSMRQIVMLAITIMVACTAVAMEYGVFPAYDRLIELREAANSSAMEYTRLKSNLAVQSKVAEEFEKKGKYAIQTDNDEATLSSFLRGLEAKARTPGVNIVNIKPMPVKDEKTHKVYRVKLSVAGRLVEILKFTSDITDGPQITGIESFSVRGTQKPNTVECNLSIRMISLKSAKPDVQRKPPRLFAQGGRLSQ